MASTRARKQARPPAGRPLPRTGDQGGRARKPAAPLDALQETAGNRAVGEVLEDEATRRAEEGLRSPGRPVDGTTRAAMEARLGHDLGSVRLHEGEAAAESAEALRAQAFTVGDHVMLGPAAPDLRSPEGTRLLAHELAHVVQQRGTRRGTHPTAQLEAQADALAAGGAPAAVGPVGATGVQRKAKVEEAPPKPAPAPEAEAEAGGGAAGKQAEEKADSGVLGSIWSGIKGAASSVWSGMKAAGQAVWGGVKAAGAWAWEGMKTVGGWIAAGAEKVWAAAQWLGRQLWSKVTGIFGRVTRWVTKLPERVGRLFAGLWEGLTSLKPWSLAWWESLGKADTWLGFLKWLGARAVDLAEILGLGEIYETVMDILKFNTRPMTAEETAEASKVFGASVQLQLVRIDEAAVIGPAFSKREYTSFHTISGWGGIHMDVLIHELTHVWQYETSGAIYMPQAIHAQAWGAGYDYKGVPGLQAMKAAGQGIAGFNREQQAQIVQDFYKLKNGMPLANGATAADLPLYADFVKDVSTLSTAQLLA